MFTIFPLYRQLGGKGAAVTSVCCSGEVTAGKTRAAGAQKTEAGRRAGKGSCILLLVTLFCCYPVLLFCVIIYKLLSVMLY